MLKKRFGRRCRAKMAKAAHSEELRTAFRKHFEETEGQVSRLERIFKILPMSRREAKSVRRSKAYWKKAPRS